MEAAGRMSFDMFNVGSSLDIGPCKCLEGFLGWGRRLAVATSTSPGIFVIYWRKASTADDFTWNDQGEGRSS